ncbi:MAG: adenylate/guanylate cyclase domain-containing protein [Dehalococcoidia bacterium]|nr:adenylate/guanylate cyclase domain-containing protein [Dehalococcoidia bacterium]
MEPRIQYARTRDGVNIAFWSLGEGPALVIPPPAMPWSHLQMEWQIPEWRGWYERLIHGRRVVRYDGRGSGLSDRSPLPGSLDDMLLDLDAVVDKLGLERFALEGFFYSGPPAIAYTARNPDRVTHLILWCSFARAADARGTGQVQEALAQLIDINWELFTETMAHTLFGWSEGDPAHRVALYMQESLTPEAARHNWQLNDAVDVSAYLTQLKAPTLVMHRKQFPVVPLDVAQGLAAQIPDARLVLLEGASLAPYLGDTETAYAAIDEFLTADEPERDHGHAHHTHGTDAGVVHTILFTDIEGSTALTQRLGDEKARVLLREHERLTRKALKAHSGSEVKTMGDGFMASFTSATRALECAVEMQRAFAQRNETSDTAVLVRIGLNAGEPIAEEEDLFGVSVVMAARIAAQAKGGEILVSNVVRELVAGKGFLFADRGDTVLRGFEDPVRVYEARWREGP